MMAQLVPREFWELVEPFIPKAKPRPKGGRPPLADRQCFSGIVFVLRRGIPWEMLPRELGFGSGMTCWRRLRDWQEAGIWQLIHFVFLNWLSRHGKIDWSRAIVDSSSVRAVFGGLQSGPNPTDRAKAWSKRHLVCDGGGIPLVVQQTGANRNDSQQALALVESVPHLLAQRGRPRHRPDCLLGDRGYDAAVIRRNLRSRNILPLIARRKQNTAVAWGGGAGLWNGPSRGLMSFGA